MQAGDAGVQAEPSSWQGAQCLLHEQGVVSLQSSQPIEGCTPQSWCTCTQACMLVHPRPHHAVTGAWNQFLCLCRCMYWDVAAYALSYSNSLKQVSNGSYVLSGIPTKAEHHSENPTARGPVSVKLGFPMATAYTTATSRKVIMNSQPKAIPWNSQGITRKKRKEKTTPFGVNLARSLVIYQAAQIKYHHQNVDASTDSLVNARMAPK